VLATIEVFVTGGKEYQAARAGLGSLIQDYEDLQEHAQKAIELVDAWEMNYPAGSDLEVARRALKDEDLKSILKPHQLCGRILKHIESLEQGLQPTAVEIAGAVIHPNIAIVSECIKLAKRHGTRGLTLFSEVDNHIADTVDQLHIDIGRAEDYQGLVGAAHRFQEWARHFADQARSFTEMARKAAPKGA